MIYTMCKKCTVGQKIKNFRPTSKLELKGIIFTEQNNQEIIQLLVYNSSLSIELRKPRLTQISSISTDL